MNKNIKFIQGNEACVEAALYAGLEFFRRLPHHPVHRNRRTPGHAAAPTGGQVHPDGRRNRFHVRHHRRLPDRQQGDDRHQRPRLFPDAGGLGLCHHGRDPLRDRQCPAGRAVHRHPHPCQPGGRQPGPLGHPRRPCHRRLDRFQPPGCVRHHGGCLQHRRNLPHPGGAAFRRSGGPYARAAGDSGAGGNPPGGAVAHLGQGGDRLPPLPAPGRRPAAHVRFRRGAPLQCHRPVPRHVGLSVGQPQGRPRAAAPPGGQDQQQRQPDGALQGILPGRRRTGSDLLRFVRPLRPARGRGAAAPGREARAAGAADPVALPGRHGPGAVQGGPSPWWWWK